VNYEISDFSGIADLEVAIFDAMNVFFEIRNNMIK
jgi:hypothetical protein